MRRPIHGTTLAHTQEDSAELEKDSQRTCMAHYDPRTPHFALNLIAELDHLDLQPVPLLLAQDPCRGQGTIAYLREDVGDSE
jgi:hypothetical protein